MRCDRAECLQSCQISCLADWLDEEPLRFVRMVPVPPDTEFDDLDF